MVKMSGIKYYLYVNLLICILFLTACPGNIFNIGSNGYGNDINSASSTSAKTIIEGNIIYQNTSEASISSIPAIGSTVYIEGTDLSTKTDFNGKFLLPYIPVNKSFYIVCEKINQDGKVLKLRKQLPKIPNGQNLYNAGTLLLKNSGSIEGYVLLKNKADSSGIDVYADEPSNVARTDKYGHFIIDDLSDGTYYIKASKPGYLKHIRTTPVTVSDNQMVSVDDILLDTYSGNQYVNIKGKVTDSANQPVNSAAVTFIDDYLSQTATLTDINGNYNLEVPPGKDYKIIVNKDFYNILLDKISITQNPNITKDFKISGNSLFKGRLSMSILNCNNQEIKNNANIKISEVNSDLPIIQQTDNFNFSNLLPGKYNLNIITPQFNISRRFSIDSLKTGQDGLQGALTQLKINAPIGDCSREINNISFLSAYISNNQLKIKFVPLDISNTPAFNNLTKDSFKIRDLIITDVNGEVLTAIGKVNDLEASQVPQDLQTFSALYINNSGLVDSDPNGIYKAAFKNFINKTVADNLFAIYTNGSTGLNINQDFSNNHSNICTIIDNINSNYPSTITNSILAIMNNYLLAPPVLQPVKANNRNILIFTSQNLAQEDKTIQSKVIDTALRLNLPVNIIYLSDKDNAGVTQDMQMLAYNTGGAFSNITDSAELSPVLQKYSYLLKGSMSINVELNMLLDRTKKYNFSCVLEVNTGNNIIPVLVKSSL